MYQECSKLVFPSSPKAHVAKNNKTKILLIHSPVFFFLVLNFSSFLKLQFKALQVIYKKALVQQWQPDIRHVMK